MINQISFPVRLWRSIMSQIAYNAILGVRIVVFITMVVSGHTIALASMSLPVSKSNFFMSCFLYMIQNITMKGERSLAVRTYPNVIQILRVHICIALL